MKNYTVRILGHAHPKVNQAISKQRSSYGPIGKDPMEGLVW
jgi:glutamate-1-semialdehyde aminotransferase